MNTSDNNDIKPITPDGTSETSKAVDKKDTEIPAIDEEKLSDDKPAGQDISSDTDPKPENPDVIDEDCYQFPSEPEASDNSIELAIKKGKEIKKQKALFLSSALMALLTAMIGVIAVNTSYRTGAHYFTESPIFTALTVISIVSVIAVIVPYFILDRASVVVSVCKDRIVRLVYLLPATSSVLCAIICSGSENNEKFTTLTVVAAAISALYFILMAFNAHPAITLLASIGHLLFCALIIITLYMEPVIEINSDFKLLVQFGAAASMLNTIADSKILLSRASTSSFFSFKIAALIFCLLSGMVTVTVFSVGGAAFDRSYLYFAILYLTQSTLAAVSLASVKTEIKKQA